MTRKSSMSTLTEPSSISLGAAQRHTPEPWTFVPDGDANHYAVVAKGKWVISFLHNGEVMPSKQIENARRIVACVNACAGIPTELFRTIDGETPANRLRILSALALDAAKLRREG